MTPQTSDSRRRVSDGLFCENFYLIDSKEITPEPFGQVKPPGENEQSLLCPALTEPDVVGAFIDLVPSPIVVASGRHRPVLLSQLAVAPETHIVNSLLGAALLPT